MATQEVLIPAVTKMLSGICTAGFTPEPDPVTGLTWIRPCREYDTVQPGDMTDDEGHLIQCCDVVALELSEPRPRPPHIENWIADFRHHRPRHRRRLEGSKRADFLAKYLDQAPDDVLIHQRRSLCLVKPERLSVQFSLDTYTAKFQARMKLTLPGGIEPTTARNPRGLPITDLKFRALGLSWLGKEGGALNLTQEALAERLGADAFYLTMGISRRWKGRHWPLVHAVHVVPDYTLGTGANVLGVN